MFLFVFYLMSCCIFLLVSIGEVASAASSSSSGAIPLTKGLLAGFSGADVQVQDDDTDSEAHDGAESINPMTEKIIEAIQATEARIMAELAKIQATSQPTQVTKIKHFMMDEDSGSDPEGLNEKMWLNIRETVSGQESKVENIYIFDNIGMVKDKIGDQLGIDSNTFRLVYNGKTLKDQYNCKDYLIKEGSTLYLLVRLQGGGFSDVLVYFIVIVFLVVYFLCLVMLLFYALVRS